MPWIETKTSAGKPVLLNLDHVSAIYCGNDGTVRLDVSDGYWDSSEAYHIIRQKIMEATRENPN